MGVGLAPGDVVDQEADHVFADALGGVWAGPACGETCGQGMDSILQLIGEVAVAAALAPS